MSVFAAKTGESAKTLLFKFTPVFGVPPPEIKIDPQSHTILISVAMIEGRDTQRQTWNGITVRYDVWGVHDPRTDALRRRICPDPSAC
jgi:hypothetical protein